MPLDGSMVATKPAGTTAVPNTVVASAPYNATIDDIYNIFNTKVQPASGGGTGVTDGKPLSNSFGIKDNLDPTKIETFDLTGLTTGQTRTAKFPDFNGTMLLQAKWTDIASAATTNLGAANGSYGNVTGSVAITALGTADAGVQRLVRFTGTPVITHNAASLIIPGAANKTAAVGDMALFVSLGAGNWVMASYQSAAGLAVSAVAGTFTPTLVTSGTQPTGVTYAVQSGLYQIVGNVVTFKLRLTLTSRGTGGTGNVLIAGLPVVATANGDESPVALTRVSNIDFAPGYSQIAAGVGDGTATIELHTIGDNVLTTQVVWGDLNAAGNSSVHIGGSYFI